MPIKLSLRILLSDAAFNELQCNSHIRKFSVKHLNQGFKNNLISGEISFWPYLWTFQSCIFWLRVLPRFRLWVKIKRGVSLLLELLKVYIFVSNNFSSLSQERHSLSKIWSVRNFPQMQRDYRNLLLILKRQTHKLLFHFCFFVGV